MFWDTFYRRYREICRCLTNDFKPKSFKRVKEKQNNKLMKNYILAITLTLAGMATAQVEKTKVKDLTPTERADRLTENMKKQLTLTPEQEVKVKAINLEHVQKQDEITARIRAAQEEKRQNTEQYKNSLKGVLTPEQQLKAQELMEERKEKAQDRRQKRGK